MAAGPVLVAAAVTPHVNKEHRATFLSLGSFAGRGAYGLILLIISTLDDIENVLRAGVVIGLLSLILLAAGHLLFKEE